MVFDAIVVGAGISGLRAAQLMGAAGLDVVVLEARDRVGGRLLSVPVGGGELDLGATWFWAGEDRVARLVRELGLAVHEQHLAGDAMYHEGQQSRRIDGNPIDVPSLRFSAGAQSVPLALAARLPEGMVRIASRVHTIEQAAEHVSVHSDAGRFQARHVVLALPPALAIASITFEPEVPDPLRDLAAATPVWMGAVVKIVAVYERAFWRDDGLAGSAISHIGPMREIHDMSGPAGKPAALFGFAPRQSPSQPRVGESTVRAQLVELFGPAAGEPTDLHIADWSAEAFTSPDGVELLGAYETYGHRGFVTSADDRVHWCSTETASVSPGHIEGALASAERVAGVIVGA